MEKHPLIVSCTKKDPKRSLHTVKILLSLFFLFPFFHAFQLQHQYQRKNVNSLKPSLQYYSQLSIHIDAPILFFRFFLSLLPPLFLSPRSISHPTHSHHDHLNISIILNTTKHQYSPLSFHPISFFHSNQHLHPLPPTP